MQSGVESGEWLRVFASLPIQASVGESGDREFLALCQFAQPDDRSFAWIKPLSAPWFEFAAQFQCILLQIHHPVLLNFERCQPH